MEEAVRRGQRHVEQARIKLGMQMDDKAFQASLLESQVMEVEIGNAREFVLIFAIGYGH